LAERTGLSLSGIRRVLVTGNRKPGMRFFSGIARAFEMPLAEVVVIWEAGERESEEAGGSSRVQSVDFGYERDSRHE